MFRVGEPTILVVEDEPTMRNLLAEWLRGIGYDVVTAADGLAALEVFEKQHPALVLLDLKLPGMHGWEVCRQLRARSDVPVLMLTALGEEADQVLGLKLGADDYVIKPFSLRVVQERLKALLRRTGYETGLLNLGPLRLDPLTLTAMVEDRSVSLTPREFALLETFVRHPGRTFTRAELLERCWDVGFEGVDRVVDVHVSSLRRKLGNKNLIATIRGRGYRLTND